MAYRESRALLEMARLHQLERRALYIGARRRLGFVSSLTEVRERTSFILISLPRHYRVIIFFARRFSHALLDYITALLDSSGPIISTRAPKAAATYRLRHDGCFYFARQP